MSQPYRIVIDEAEVRRFYEECLKQYENERYLVFVIFIMTRRKYWKPLSKSQIKLDRKVFRCQTGDVEKFVRTLRKYEIVQGLYVDTNDQPIPNEAIVTYMTCNPLDELNATFKLQQEIAEKMKIMVFSRKEESLPPLNFDSIFKNCLHATPVKRFVKLDIDTKDPELLRELQAFLKSLPDCQESIAYTVETKNGYHCMLRVGKNLGALYEYNRKIAQSKKNKNDDPWFSIEKGSPQVAIPGTNQSGFVPRLVDFLNLEFEIKK